MKAIGVLKPFGIVAAIIVLLFPVYQVLWIFPQPLFSHRVAYKQIAIYSRAERPKDIDAITPDEGIKHLLSGDGNIPGLLFSFSSYNGDSNSFPRIKH